MLTVSIFQYQLTLTPIARDGEVELSPTPTLTPLRGRLTEEQIMAVLKTAEWPFALRDEAVTVSWGESGWNTDAIGDSGNALGLFQLWPVWREYCEISTEQALEAVTNAFCAWKVYRYDLATGQDGWAQWTVKP